VISVVGCGPGHREGFTVEALRVVRQSEVLIGAPHLLEIFDRHPGQRLPVVRSIDALEILRKHVDKKCAVLVSGDPGLASLGAKVREYFGGQVRVVPGVSSAQAACAVAGWPWEGAGFFSLHAQGGGLPDPDRLRGLRSLVVLGGGDRSARELASWLEADGGDWECAWVRDIGSGSESLQVASGSELENVDGRGRVVFLARRRVP